MDLLARHLIFCIVLGFFPINAYADKSDHNEVGRNRTKNYAAIECAQVIGSNPEATNAAHMINGMADEYMLNPCGAKIWFVIELCDRIQATSIEIASYELYSSKLKEFTVYASDSYPVKEWNLIGHFTAADSRSLQKFDLKQVGFGKFIRVELHSHYGNEYYCVISDVKVYGASMMEEYLVAGDNPQENDNKTHNNPKAPKRKTSAYRVYRNMMIGPNVCGLTVKPSTTVGSTPNVTVSKSFYESKEQPIINPVIPQPTQQPNVTNRTAPLKPSIFVELGNKVKAIETSQKTRNEDIEKKLNEMEKFVKKEVTKLNLKFDSFALIIIAYYVYKLMLDTMQ
jgi:hypothetical protein